jgi:hypothetical protein
MPSKKEKSGYVFIFYAQHPGSKRYKIGFAEDVNRRLKTLNGKQSPYPVITIKSVKVINAVSLEKTLHSKYAEYRKHNEWFDFEDDQLASVLQDMDELERISGSSKVREGMTSKSFLFLMWCRHNNIFNKEPVHKITLGNFNFVLRIEENVFNAVYVKYFDYGSIYGLTESVVTKTYKEVKKQIKR